MSFFKSQHVVVTFYDLEVYMKKNKCLFKERIVKGRKKYHLFEFNNPELDFRPLTTNFKWNIEENLITFWHK